MRQRGFTTIELVAVMVIIAVLAAVIVPRLSPGGFDRYAFRHELLSALRYAQKTAMASGCSVAVDLNAADDRYVVTVRTGGNANTCGSGGFGDPLSHPTSGGDYAGRGVVGVDLQTTGSVTFNGFGEPEPSSVNSIALAGGPAIQIDPVTGYIRDG